MQKNENYLYPLYIAFFQGYSFYIQSIYTGYTLKHIPFPQNSIVTKKSIPALSASTELALP